MQLCDRRRHAIDDMARIIIRENTVEASSPITFAVVGLIAGFLIGLACYRLFSKSERDTAALKQTLLEREHKIAELKQAMGSSLTGIQQRLDSIRQETNQIEAQIADEAAQWQLTSVKTSHHKAAATAENDADLAMPRDYAAGKNGTLSEGFGLKEHQKSDSDTLAQPPRY
ncbi:ZapG family protein [Halomonas sp. 18071143]|uniref:ZapG family protein n=1 Tax=Halomonas sp. 18071143 TaxID=2855441 RepID=UPI00210EFE40|nr:DUF1043 family protein [Halomonas sp. 18071143]